RQGVYRGCGQADALAAAGGGRAGAAPVRLCLGHAAQAIEAGCDRGTRRYRRGCNQGGTWSLMHIVFRESRGLEETATPRDLDQQPAELVALSFSDSDLAAFAAGGRRARPSLPSLRLANLAELRHPLSVDTYVER